MKMTMQIQTLVLLVVMFSGVTGEIGTRKHAHHGEDPHVDSAVDDLEASRADLEASSETDVDTMGSEEEETDLEASSGASETPADDSETPEGASVEDPDEPHERQGSSFERGPRGSSRIPTSLKLPDEPSSAAVSAAPPPVKLHQHKHSDTVARRNAPTLKTAAPALLRQSLSSMQEKLENAQRELAQKRLVEEDLRKQQGTALTHCQQQLADAHKADQKEVDRLRAENKKLTSSNEKMQKYVASLKDNVDEAEAARKAKTQELALKVKEVERLKKKEKDDLASLQKKDGAQIVNLKQQFRNEEAKQQADCKKQKQQAQDQITMLQKSVHDLNSTDMTLTLDRSKLRKQVKNGQAQLTKAEMKMAAEHKAFINANNEITSQKAQHDKDKATLKVDTQLLKAQVDQLHKAQQQIHDLAQANAALKNINVHRSNAVDTVTKKLADEGNTLKATRNELKHTTAKLQEATLAKQKTDVRVHEQFQALKQKNAQWQIHDGELQTKQHEVSSISEEKNTLAKELSITQSKLVHMAAEHKDLNVARTEMSELSHKISTEDKELDAMRKKLKEADQKTAEYNIGKAKLVESTAEQKELADQLAAEKKLEKDRLSAAAEKVELLNARLASAAQRENTLNAQRNEQTAELKKKDKAVHDALQEGARLQQQDSIGAASVQDVSDEDFLLAGGSEKLQAAPRKSHIAKASLLLGRSNVRSLAAKEKQLQSALGQIQGMQTEVNAQDRELEQARNALLHAANMQLPTASAQEAAAARTALENVNGQLDKAEQKLNNAKTELSASNAENSIEEEQLHALQHNKVESAGEVEKLKGVLVQVYREKQDVEDNLMALKAKVTRAEKVRKDTLRQAADMKKITKEKHAREVAKQSADMEKIIVAKQSADAKAAAAKVAADQNQVRLQQQQKQNAQAQSRKGQDKGNDGGEDDDDDDDDSSDSSSAFAATVPWRHIQATLSKNVKLAEKAISL